MCEYQRLRIFQISVWGCSIRIEFLQVQCSPWMFCSHGHKSFYLIHLQFFRKIRMQVWRCCISKKLSQCLLFSSSEQTGSVDRNVVLLRDVCRWHLREDYAQQNWFIFSGLRCDCVHVIIKRRWRITLPSKFHRFECFSVEMLVSLVRWYLKLALNSSEKLGHCILYKVPAEHFVLWRLKVFSVFLEL